ncbi:SH3 and multiple ankyrin repeat domains protein 3-like isoform X6 [Ostrea edulis]|uniref:SH3 and multiple ankyrin repeat domains protein 3-like isoform X6 n=1 Tax=Ostrea edulis TaxID=37623 RepID=UPI0024AFF913|nr:SH3 and multiple ankyrin repeat domains protein 3-like isoform X6 [Ostrea edulis]XP_056013644.1 SH3 and multiple ankyrin repeat domains protein 3-like isoform X6 [Ostrea edulis]
MVFEMSIQDFNDQTQDHMYPHHNGVVDYREGSFISEEVKGYQEPGVYHSDSQVGTVFIRISVPELKLQKCLQFELDETVWQAKHRVLSSFAKDLKDSINYGLYCPPMNGRAGKFLDEERLLREYPLQGPIGFLEFKYKKRVYKMMHVNVRKLKQLHVKSNLRHFIDYIRTCNIEKVNKMTNKGLDPNFHDSSSGETPLCLAVSMNKPKSREMIISLAGGGAHLDFRNKKGMTALHVAVIAGNTEAIKTLLDLGVSPNMKDSRSLTPLYYTVCHCTGPGCMEMLLQERAFIGSQDEQGWFEIHHACRQGLVQHLEHLLFYGADMDVQNASGNTALHVCALHNRESCLRVLLFRGANKEILNYSSQSPYESAILAGNSVIAEIIEGHKDEDVVTFRETPRFSTRRRDSVASAAMFALYRSRSDPRINHILISPSSSTNSFSHLHNSQNMDSYSGSRGTDSPCSMSLSSSSSGPVLGVGEQGFWEGRVNGNEGMFPSNYVQEVKLRRKAGSLGDLVSAARHDMMLNRNTLAAIVPNFSEYAPRSVVLQKGPEGYGFVLRGAKSQTHATGELDFRPTAEFPALQYLDSVDPGSRADRVGLKTGDFILEINGENVVRASHDRVVQLIRHSGDTLALKVVTVKPLEKPDHWLQHHNGTMTLPNRGGPKRQAPQPPQRDPQTSLSVGKAQGKQYAEGMAELDQLDLALAEYEKQSVHSAVSSDQKTASIRSKHSAKRVSCVELDKIENPDSKAATTKGKGKDYMSPSEIRIQKYHHKKGANLERSSSTPSLVDKKTEAVYATPTVPSTEQNDMGHRRSSSGAAISHIYATPGERPRAPPPPPPAGTSTSSPKRPAPAPPTRPQAEIISISTDRRKSSLTSMTDSVHSVEKPASEYESSFRPGISAQLSTEPKISTLSLQQVKLRSHNRNSSQVSVQSTDSGESKRSEEKLGVTFAEDKVQDQAHLFLQKHPNAQLLVTTNIHAKNKDRKMSEPEPDYDSDENDAKVKSKVTVISVGGGVENSKKYTVKSDIPSGEGGMFIPPPPSEPAPKPPSQKPPSPLPKPAKQDIDIKLSLSTEKKDMEQSITKNVETSSVKSEETALSSSTVKFSEPEPRNIPPAPPAPPPPPPAPPAPPPPGVMAPEEKPKTPPPVFEKKPKNPVQGIPSKAIMDAVAQRKTRIEAEGMKISKGPNKEAPVKDGNDLRNRMLDNTHSAILAAVAKRRAVLEEKDSEHTVADEIENRLQKTKKLQSAKYYFSSESIQKKDTEKTNKVGTKTETNAKEITPTIVKPTTPTSISPITTKPPSPVPSKKTKPPSPVPSKKTKPPSPVPSKKTKPPSPVPPRKISPSIPGAKTLPTATKTAKPTATKATEKTQTAPKPIYISSTKPPSPKLKKAPSPIPVQSRAPETSPDKAKATSHEKSSTVGEGKGVEKDENEDLLAKAEKVRQDWLQKKSSSTSLKSPRDVTRNPSKLNSPRRTTSKAGAKTDNLDTKESSAPKMNGMTLPLNKEENKSTSVQSKPSNSAKGLVQVQSAKSSDKSGITPMKTSKDSEVLLKTKNIRDRIANFEKGKPAVNGKSDSDSKIPVHGVTLDSSITDKSPALPPPPEFGDAVQLEIIPPPSGFNLTDNLESPTYSSAFHHSDSSSVSTLSTLSDDHMDNKTKHSYEDLIAPPPPGFDDNSEDSGVIPPPPDFGESKPAMKSNNKTYNKPFLSKPLSGWQCLDVLDWLDSIQMAQYKKSFQQHCIDGKKLGGLQRNDYIQLGVTQVGHRMSMERAIKKASNIITGTHL